MYEYITVDKSGDALYMAVYYDTYEIQEDGTVWYLPVLNGKLRKYKWVAWIDALIWAIKTHVSLA